MVSLARGRASIAQARPEQWGLRLPDYEAHFANNRAMQVVLHRVFGGADERAWGKSYLRDSGVLTDVVIAQ
jgi:hypothetical protein